MLLPVAIPSSVEVKTIALTHDFSSYLLETIKSKTETEQQLSGILSADKLSDLI